MRTRIDIDADLLRAAREHGRFATEREAVEAGLRLVVARARADGVSPTSVIDPVDDRLARRALIASVRAAGRAAAVPGADAAHSQDFLYGDDGMPA